MNIKKQIRRLYIFTALNGLMFTETIWVFFLLSRGFSMIEVGIAEAVFHAVSLCFEVPSGMLSDLLGRRRTLICSCIASALSGITMIFSTNFGEILLSMGLSAISYNLISGTKEALTYDSLLQADREDEYLKISAKQGALFSCMDGFSSLFSVITIGLGYRIGELLNVIRSCFAMGVATGLNEAEVKNKAASIDTIQKFGKELGIHFKKSISFLINNAKIRRRMFLSGLVSAGCYIVCMILQQHLPSYGLPERLVGIPILFVSMAEMLGAILAEKTGKKNLRKTALFSACMTGFLLCLTGSHSVTFSILAAMGANCVSQITLIRLDSENQKEFASEIRATMVSVGSLVYSLCMIVLSPMVPFLASFLGNSGEMVVLGGLIICGAVYLVWKDIEA